MGSDTHKIASQAIRVIRAPQPRLHSPPAQTRRRAEWSVPPRLHPPMSCPRSARTASSAVRSCMHVDSGAYFPTSSAVCSVVHTTSSETSTSSRGISMWNGCRYFLTMACSSSPGRTCRRLLNGNNTHGPENHTPPEDGRLVLLTPRHCPCTWPSPSL